MKKIRFGIVGCGKIAECHHIPLILALGDKKAEIAAMYDIKRGKAEKLAAEKKLAPKFCRSLPELLDAGVDAVVIATPNNFHLPQALECLKAGKHILLEKPMCTHTRDADRIIDLAIKSNLVLMINQARRTQPLHQEIQRQVAAGAVGPVIHIRCLRAAASSPDVGWSPGATWFVKKRYEGSLITDIAVHMADAMQDIVGEVKSILAVNRNRNHEVPDNVTALFDFKNGATGVLELSWTFPESVNALEIYGEKGTLATTDEGFEIRCPGKEAKKVVAKDIKPVPTMHELFLKAIEKKAMEGWTVGRSALALCEAIARSGREGKAVRPRNRKK